MLTCVGGNASLKGGTNADGGVSRRVKQRAPLFPQANEMT